MMERRHPQGLPASPGARLRYWIVSERRGRLGGIGFRAACWHSKARDELIGWGPRARAANIGRLAENDRFLILPGVRVRNLASRVLALARGARPGAGQGDRMGAGAGASRRGRMGGAGMRPQRPSRHPDPGPHCRDGRGGYCFRCSAICFREEAAMAVPAV